MRTLFLQSTARRVVFAGALVAGLAAAGIAIAGPEIGSSAPVTATFSANTSVRSSTQTCTATNGDSVLLTEATFTGTATSTTPSLNGPLTINVRSAFDTKTSVGSVDASLAIGASSGQPGFVGFLEGVDSNGTVQGFLQGNAGKGTRVLGSVTTTYSGSGFGSTSAPGTIGSGTATNTAIAMTAGCGVTPAPTPPSPPPPKPIPVHPLPPVHPQGNQGENRDQHGPKGHFFGHGRNGRED